jgi:hypothetical protein
MDHNYYSSEYMDNAMTKFQKALIVLFGIFLIWLFVCNRYLIVSSNGVAYKVNRITGRVSNVSYTSEVNCHRIYHLNDITHEKTDSGILVEPVK